MRRFRSFSPARTSGPRRRCRLAHGAVDLRARPCPREDRRALRRAEHPRVLADVRGRALPGRPRRHEPRLHRAGDRARVRRDLSCRLQGERRDAADAMTARAFLRDDRGDVLREARSRSRTPALVSPRAIASAAIGTASATRDTAAIAMRDPLRMLGVICTPKLAQHAADLADGAAHAKRLAHGGEEVRVGLAAARTSASARATASASRSARTRAVRSRCRRSISGSTWRSSTRSAPSSANAFTPTTTRSPDSTSLW